MGKTKSAEENEVNVEEVYEADLTNPTDVNILLTEAKGKATYYVARVEILEKLLSDLNKNLGS